MKYTDLCMYAQTYGFVPIKILKDLGRGTFTFFLYAQLCLDRLFFFFCNSHLLLSEIKKITKYPLHQ